MLMLNVTSITNISTTFNISFSFILAKDKEAYELIIRALKGARVNSNMLELSILLIDFKTSLKKAL